MTEIQKINLLRHIREELANLNKNLDAIFTAIAQILKEVIDTDE